MTTSVIQLDTRRFQAVLALAFSLVLILSLPAFAEKRVALLIGNGDYQNTMSLKNPSRDAKAVAQKLRSLGFETIEGYDLDFLGVRAKAREFAMKSQNADISLFYYAGHGVAVNGQNYIVPVDVKLADATAVDFETVPVKMITDQMKFGTGVNLVLLDACRDNPLIAQLNSATQASTRSLSIGSGLAEMDLSNAGEGLAIAFATSPGALAEDGTGDHSPFTTALLRHIGAANVDFTEIMSRVTGDVYEMTEQRQRPWLNASLTGSVVLNRVETPAAVQPAQTASAATAPAAAAGGSLDMQKFMFDIARESEDPADYRAYLDSFPKGAFAAMARNAIERLEAAEETTELASARTATSETQSTRRIQAFGPLVLTVTRELIALPSTEATEQALFLDKTARRTLQARLNASGNNVGYPDGALGPKSRAGIRGWQSAQGLVPTGYMNQPQLDLLASQTEATYKQFLTVPKKKTSRRTSSSRKTNRRSNNNANVNNAINSFVNGLGQGIGSRLLR